MSATVVPIAVSDPTVLTPQIADVLQAMIAYLTTIQGIQAQINVTLQSVQAYAAEAQAAEDNVRALLSSIQAQGAPYVANKVTFGRVPIPDANYPMTATNVGVVYVALTAPRTITLPPASACPANQPYTVTDETGNCSSTAALTIVPSGTDMIGGTSNNQLVLASAYGSVTMKSNGSSLWTIQ